MFLFIPHDNSQLLQINGAVSIMVKQREGFLELNDLFLCQFFCSTAPTGSNLLSLLSFPVSFVWVNPRVFKYSFKLFIVRSVFSEELCFPRCWMVQWGADGSSREPDVDPNRSSLLKMKKIQTQPWISFKIYLCLSSSTAGLILVLKREHVRSLLLFQLYFFVFIFSS